MKMHMFPLILLGMTISCQANADNPVNTVEVHGTGAITVPSDIVVLRLSVTTCHADLREAKKRNDQIAAPIYELAESQHVARPTLLATRMNFDFVPPQSAANQEDEKVQSNQLFQGGKKGVAQGRAEPPEPPIHLARDLEMKFHDLNQAIKFVAEMVKWDPVRTTCELRLAPLSFGVSSRDKQLAEARRRAVASAREKAQLLAEQNGLKLGSATLIFDESSDFIGDPNRPAAAAPLLPPGAFDPFGAAPPAETRGYSPTMRLVAMQKEVPEKIDLDHVPPAQVTISASVKIVFEVTK
jgi:uncharacterized protein YggE